MVLLLIATLLLATEPVEWLQESVIELPTTVQGESVTSELRFRNISGAPVLVENVRVGCGCTATEWQDTPVAPGEIGSIEVTYDAMNAGYYRKYVKVYFHDHRGGHKFWLEGLVEGGTN